MVYCSWYYSFLDFTVVLYRHTLLNTRKLPVYSTCRLCQQIQTLTLLVVVQALCTMG
jgi:hypothetical protein